MVDSKDCRDLARHLLDFAEQGFQSKKLSDLTICCKDSDGVVKHFYVHKMVLCLQSKFFETTCRPNSPFVVSNFVRVQIRTPKLSQEARTGIVTLEDDPYIVRLMLEVLYGKRNHSHDWQAQQNLYPGLSTIDKAILCIVDTFAVADKYQASYVMNRSADLISRNMLEFDLEKPDMAEISRFINLVKRVFETTPDSVRTLRNLVYRHTKKYFVVLMNTTMFQSEMDKIDGFWGGYVRYLSFFVFRARWCPSCKKKTTQADTEEIKDGEMVVTCPWCDKQNSVDAWNRPNDQEVHTGNVRATSQEENSRKRQRTSSE
ncbi:uncharacterized protein BKA78DRAFT_298708 [Phyllosticta capitalensis]|uniref:uncharacterized protein n=1 Tax=Phyllosticta capitalensis TaxID=121624 RepID=UPI00312F7671